MATVSSYLHMEFLDSDGKTRTVKVADPADTITSGTVEAAASSFVGNNVFLWGTASATELSDAYIMTTTKTELPSA